MDAMQYCRRSGCTMMRRLIAIASVHARCRANRFCGFSICGCDLDFLCGIVDLRNDIRVLQFRGPCHGWRKFRVERSVAFAGAWATIFSDEFVQFIGICNRHRLGILFQFNEETSSRNPAGMDLLLCRSSSTKIA